MSNPYGDGEMVVSIECAATAGGMIYVGQLFRGDHPAVAAAPSLFLLFPATTEQIEGARAALAQKAYNRNNGELVG